MRGANSALDLLGRPLGRRYRRDFIVHGEVRASQSRGGECLEDADLHSRQSTGVDQCASRFEERSEVLHTRCDIVVGVRAVPRLREGLATDDRVICEILVFIGKRTNPRVVKEIRSIGGSHHEVDLALAWTIPLCMRWRLWRGADKQLMKHPPKGSDASSCRREEVVVCAGVDR